MLKLNRKLSSCLVQIILTACFVFALSGGAFLIDWFGISQWKRIASISLSAAIVILLISAIVLYLKDKERFFSLQPFRLINDFFNLPPLCSVGFLFAAFFTTQISQQLAMHYGLETHLWDLGFYDQVLWNTAFGDFMVTSVRGGIHVFAEHFKPIMVLLAGLYRFQSDTWFLLSCTTLLTSSSLVAVYLIAQAVIRSHRSALTLVICVFFYSPLVHGLNFLYHTQMLIDPFLLFGFFCVLSKRMFWAAALFFLGLSCKESAVPDLLGIGLFLLARKNTMPGRFVTALAIAWLALYVFWAKPHFVFATHFKNIWHYYSGWLQPTLQTFSLCLNPNPLDYLIRIFAPFLFLSFFCRRWYLLLGPSLLFRLLSLDPSLRTTTYHYTGGLDALIFISAIYGFESWTNSSVSSRMAGFFARVLTSLKNPAVLCPCLLLIALFFSGRPQLLIVERFLDKASAPDNQRIIRVLESIPSRYSVLGSESLAAHFSHRSRMYAFCSMFKGAPYESSAKRPDLIVYNTQVEDPCGKASLETLIMSGYRQFYQTDFLQIYSHPENQQIPVADLTNKWDVMTGRPIVPYRSLFRSWYVCFLIVGAVMVFMFSRLKRLSPGGFCFLFSPGI